MNYDKILLKILITDKNKININKFRKITFYQLYPNIKEYLLNRFVDSDSLQETINRIKYHIEIRPVCKVCGNRVKYINYKEKLFREYCSSSCKCKSKEVKEKIKQTCLEKYGETTPLKNKEVKEKIKQTCIEKYGETTPLKNKEVKEKIKQTCLEKYGTENPLKNKEIKEKIKQTCLEKYGTENPTSNPLIYNKIRSTCIKKYGVPYLMQNDEIKNKSNQVCLKKYGVINAGGSVESLNKIKQTCLNKYGVDTYFKTKECIMKSHTKEVLNKSMETKRKNHTFNTSKPEKELYLYIKEKFPLVKIQYNSDKRYPWYCDFYIPELDYFVELNGTWTHGKHPFDATSIQDQIILEKWKEKSKKHPFYINAIETWTKRDVEKRSKAKENNINFKEVWSLEEGKKFIDELYGTTESTITTN